MDRLEDIGFYTLEDNRAKNVSIDSSLWRCEMVLTNRCNFHCTYCRGFGMNDISKQKAINIIKLWIDEGLKNIRFSGGEPTLYPYLIDLVSFSKDNEIKRIAISTNGSAKLRTYCDLISAGVNDFSISLDSCCVSENNIMSGTNYKMWNHVTHMIEVLSSLTYVTVGIVLNETNIASCIETIKYCDKLGVDDIRVIPSAQYDKKLFELPLLENHPILNYRMKNIYLGRSVRGIKKQDSHKCNLVLDDMSVDNKYHYPCIIYFREGGKAIGKINKNMREDRRNWILNHDTHHDKICSNNCLDVCIDYNNRVRYFQGLSFYN